MNQKSSKSADRLWDAARPHLDEHTPVLIAGATASGKSDLAMRIAETFGGIVVNADAMQVYACWRVLTARPSVEDEARVPHSHYGHVPCDTDHNVGDWLRSVGSLLSEPVRPIFVGGTGLFFRALTEGLTDIPPIPEDIQADAQNRFEDAGLPALLEDIDPETKSAIDIQNPARVMRAWQVTKATGQSILTWQRNTPPAFLPLNKTIAFHLDADREWLNERIGRRFDIMLASGALDEVEKNRDLWDPNRLSSKAIGAPELMAYQNGELPLEQARDLSIIATRQYAKRQRTWFRKRMKDWHQMPLGLEN